MSLFSIILLAFRLVVQFKMVEIENMDVDEQNKTEKSDVKSSDRIELMKQKLIRQLFDAETNLSKSLTLAITIQTMFSKDLEALEKLFQFFIEKNQIEMATDLWQNDLLKNFNLSEVKP
jgi:hypothetical protein